MSRANASSLSSISSAPSSNQRAHRSISKGRKSLVIAMVRDGHSISRDRVGRRVGSESCSSSVARKGECKGTSSRRSRNCLSVSRESGSGMSHSMLTVVFLLGWCSSCLVGCQLKKQTRSSDPRVSPLRDRLNAPAPTIRIQKMSRESTSVPSPTALTQSRDHTTTVKLTC